MSPKTIQFLDEKRIYVSWGILVCVILGTVMITKIMFQQDSFIEAMKSLDARVTRIETDLYFNKIEQL